MVVLFVGHRVSSVFDLWGGSQAARCGAAAWSRCSLFPVVVEGDLLEVAGEGGAFDLLPVGGDGG